MDESQMSDDERLAFEVYELESEMDIQATIEQLKLKEKPRVWLEREVAKLRLQLKTIEEENATELPLTILKYKLFRVKTKMFTEVMQASGSRNSEEGRAIKKAKRLWKKACDEGKVKPRGKGVEGKAGFIEQMQLDHPNDIGKLSFENLYNNELKFPKS